MERLKSRKLWVTVGTIVSVIAAEGFGVNIDPQAIVGLAGIVIAYVAGQSWVDKNATTAAVTGEFDVARAQLLAYARRLEAELAAINDGAVVDLPVGAEITN